jgi:hypothetical protein
VAGVFAGPGNHIVLIVIGVVVVSAVLPALIAFVLSRRESHVASVTAAPLQGGDGALRLERRWTSLAGTGGNALAGGTKPFTIAIDGSAVGTLAPNETVEVAVKPGHHTVRLSQGRHLSPERSLDVAPNEVVSFYCHGPRYGWPQFLAALFKPDLWITLKRY